MRELEPSALNEEGHSDAVKAIRSAAIDNFSLVWCGPVYRALSVLGMGAPCLKAAIVRTVLLVLLTWVPLLILALWQGILFGNRVHIPFLYDYAVNVRFLVSLPLLVFADVIIDPKVKHAVRHFVNSGLVSARQLESFEAAISKTNKLGNAILPLVLLVVLAWAPSLRGYGGELMPSGATTWHYLPNGNTLSLAGWWFALVSVPFYRLLLFRWIWLIIIWGSFLTRAGNLNLDWIPTHPDKAGGLGFLAHTQIFFGWIGFAASASVAADFANRISYEQQSVGSLKFVILGSSLVTIGILAAPLLTLSYRLYKIKEKGLFEYGTLGSHYVQAFDAKWNRGKPPEHEDLLGTADLQSLADLSNSFAVVEGMRLVLADRQTLLWLAIPTVVPMAVLLILETPAEQIIHTVLKLLA